MANDKEIQAAYGLRARYVRRGFTKGADEAAGTEKHNSGAAEAVVAVGLKPKEMTKQERQVFGNRTHEYLRARDKILLKWWEDCICPVSLKALLDAADDSSLNITRDAFYFLQENGYINFGILQEPVEPEAASGAAASTAAAAAEQAAPDEPIEDERAIVFKLYELLRAADMETTSEKAIRKELQKHFKTDISDKKALVKEHVNYFIEHLDEKDTLEPKGYEGKADPAQAAAAAEKAKAKKAAAAAAAAANRTAAAAPPPKPAGRVIIVGAGPAGLAAATLLKRNNVDVLVLEARDRVGGRVHSYQGAFSAPVDLGASLVTGTAPDTVEGLAPDPVSFVCKQLGIKLHQLAGELPIYDATGQLVPDETDKAVDRLRDDLLDAAREMADEDETAAKQQSLGAALQQALEQRLQKLQAAASGAAPPQIDTAANGTSSKAAADADESAEKLDTVKQEEDGETAQQAATAADADATVQQQQQQQEGAEPKLQPDSEAAETALAVAKAEDASAAETVATSAPTPEQLELLDWHWANLEYGCSAALTEVSLPYWNQDEEWGGFGGPHCMVTGGFGQAMQGLADKLGDALHLNTPVTRIEYRDGDQEQDQQHQQGGENADAKGKSSSSASVKVTTASGEVHDGAIVLVTLPLGVLKAGGVEFVPPLPEWKSCVITRMGFGDLNKVVLEFPEVFWDEVDYFGITQPGGPEGRGRCFMFWNLARFNGGVPLLTSLVSGASARAAEHASSEDMQEHMLQALRRVYGDKVPQPIACHTTKWASEEYSRGSYSYVAVGCSGSDYDSLALPVARQVLFAGEHTCKEHPDTVGGAMLSGMREAARALHLLRGPDDDHYASLVSSRTETCSRADKRKRKQDDAEDEAGWSDEGSGEQRKRRKKEKKEKKEKKKDKKEKKEKKRKEESEEEAASGDEEQGVAGRRGRERRAAAPPQMDMASRIAAREHMRNDITRLWRGLLDAQQGDVGVVNDVLASCDSLDARQQCMAALMRASPEAIRYLSEDAVFLKAVHDWLSELLPERSDANLHVIHKILELLAKLTSSWAALSSCGLLDSIKSASEHRNRDVVKAAADVRKDWLSRNPNKPRPAAPAARKAGTQQQQAQKQQAQKQQAAKQQQQQQHRRSQSGGGFAAALAAVSTGAAAPSAADAAAADAAAELVELLAPGEREELEATQAAVRLAQAQAEAAAAQLAALQQAMPVVPHAGRIASFGEYKRTAKRQQADYDGDDDEIEVEVAAAKRAKSGSHHTREGSSGAADVPSDPKDKATKELREFVKVQLKPRFQAKELDTEDCKWVLGKVVEKVMANTSALDMAKSGEKFVNPKREKKVAGLTDSYVERRKQEKAKQQGKEGKHKAAAAGK